MQDKKGGKKYWSKLLHKYRFVIMTDSSFEEKMVVKMSRLNVLFCLAVVGVVYFFCILLLIGYTPLNKYVPGKSSKEVQKNLNRLVFADDKYYRYSIGENVDVFVFQQPIYIYKNDVDKLKSSGGTMGLSPPNGKLDFFENTIEKRIDEVNISCQKISQDQDDIDSIFYKLNKINYEKFRDIILYILHYFLIFIIFLVAFRLNLLLIKHTYKLFQKITKFYNCMGGKGICGLCSSN